MCDHEGVEEGDPGEVIPSVIVYLFMCHVTQSSRYLRICYLAECMQNQLYSRKRHTLCEGTHAFTCTNTFTKNTHIHTCIHVHTFTHAYTQIYTHILLCTHADIHIDVHILTCIRAYANTHMHCTHTHNTFLCILT